ncbi:MAG: thioredoxin family protein [Alistipes sp.]|nr:thioredoxin family protein [Alistipes sp.]
MKRLLTLAATLLAMAAATAQVRFETASPSRLRQRAAEQHKLIFMDLTASWCGPCRDMARKVFTDKQVGEFMDAGFLCVKIDVDTDEGQAIANAYEVQYIPTYLIFAPDMELIGRSSGARSRENFIKDMQTVLDHYRKLYPEAEDAVQPSE